jgi:hypothetical protein
VGAGLLAHVLVSKYKDHLPLYRQAGMLRRLDLDVARSTLCDWVAGGARLLGPVAGAIRRSVLAQDPIQADETPVQVQQGPKGRPKEAYFFAYRGCESGEVFYDFRMGRGSEGPAEVLADFHGTLQIDGYQGYDRIVRDNGLVAAGCLDHARRKFFDAIESAPNEAALVLVAMRRLYKIEERAVGMTAEDRGRLRARESRPRLDQLHELIETLARDTLPSSRLGKACSYALNQWEHLSVFVQDGRVEISNAAIERAMRGIAMGRRAWLFAGNEAGGERAAVMYTIIESCRAADVEPMAYLADVVERLPAMTPEQAATLTPRLWAAARAG